MARPVVEMEGKRFGKLVVMKMAEESLASHTGNKLWYVNVIVEMKLL